QRDAEGGEHQHKRHEHDQGHGIAQWSKPGSPKRSKQEIRTTQNQIGQRQRPSKAKSVGDSSPESSEKPDQASEQPSEAAGLLDSKIQCLMKITSQRCKGGIVGKPLEQLTNVSDPEGTLESGTNLM